ncbi:MAG: hypothetical protein DU429_07710 [Candidatus Tokpelaia sp.]|nr:MAG: hypothetical protein DU429_07710 [Candidatus Tokpelaia sp.]KAA6206294.1 MAG: hypothetical protein DU430_01895 [Candidatus Tokpelaia sp.]
MKYGYLCFLTFIVLLLGGCTPMPGQIAGPQGGGEPLPLNDSEPLPRALIPQRPMRRQRRNACLGRSVSPTENAACAACGGGACCDYPVWLHEAQRQNGLYMAYDRQAALAAEQNNDKKNLPLVFSPLAAGAEQNGLLPAEELSLLPAARAPAGYQTVPAGPRREGSWSGLYADWCLAHAFNPKTGQYYAGLAAGAAGAENWLHYGVGSEACLGALMVAEQQGTYNIAFCLGALSVPVNGAGGQKSTAIIYLGLGVKDKGMAPGNRIGFVAFAAANIAAFRLPAGYHPCKEHFKLEQTPWAALFEEKILARQKQRQMEAADKPAYEAQQAAAGPDGRRPGAGDLPVNGAYGNEQVDDRALQAAIERDLMEQDWAATDFHKAGFANKKYSQNIWQNFAGQQASGAAAAPVTEWR